MVVDFLNRVIVLDQQLLIRTFVASNRLNGTRRTASHRSVGMSVAGNAAGDANEQ